MCLEIYSVALLSTSDKMNGIYANDIKPHDIFMNIPVPKCSGEKNTPFYVMISEIIGSATSRRIFRVLFYSGSN